MEINRPEQIVIGAVAIAVVIIVGDIGGPIGLLFAWGLMVPIGGWYGIRKAKEWNAAQDFS